MLIGLLFLPRRELIYVQVFLGSIDLEQSSILSWKTFYFIFASQYLLYFVILGTSPNETERHVLLLAFCGNLGFSLVI